MSTLSRLRDPNDLLTVSAAPQFLWHSGGVGWQGASFSELLTAPAGIVDHVHEHYCLRRTHAAYRRRKSGQVGWEWVPIGWSLREPGEEQRSEWKGGGRRQFLFVSIERIEEVLEGRLPANASARSGVNTTSTCAWNTTVVKRLAASIAMRRSRFDGFTTATLVLGARPRAAIEGRV